jgi:hypothetical protein
MIRKPPHVERDQLYVREFPGNSTENTSTAGPTHAAYLTTANDAVSIVESPETFQPIRETYYAKAMNS